MRIPPIETVPLGKFPDERAIVAAVGIRIQKAPAGSLRSRVRHSRTVKSDPIGLSSVGVMQHSPA